MARKRKKDADGVDSPNEWTADLAAAAPTFRAGSPEPTDAPPQPSYLGPVIAVLLCMPFGLLALVYAMQTPIRWRRGDQSGSRHAAAQSELWMYASVGAFVLMAIGYGLVWVFYLRNRSPYG